MTTQQKKKRLRSKADKLWMFACLKKWGNQCELCGKPAEQVHHFYPKGTYGHLRYDLDNGVPLCKGCHFKLHHKDASLEAEIRERRGKRWYKRLQKKAQERPSSYYTISWLQDNIKRLQSYLDEEEDQ